MEEKEEDVRLGSVKLLVQIKLCEMSLIWDISLLNWTSFTVLAFEEVMR